MPATFTSRGSLLIALATFAACALPAVAQDAPPATGVLRWKNGDELTGRLVEATPQQLTWKSDVLSQNVALDLSVLESVQFPAVPSIPAKVDSDLFHVVLGHGMRLEGALRQITPTQIVINSPRHGEVSLDRGWIDSLRRMTPGGTIDLVGSRGEGWRSVDPRWVDKKEPLEDWDVSQPERVGTELAGARLYLRTELPEFCDIELTVQSTRRPAFSLALGSIRHLQKRTGNLEIETWGDELVVTSPASQEAMTFEHLGQLKADTRSVSMRIFWHRRTGKVRVFSPGTGEPVEAKLALAPDITTGGVLLENKGADLLVTRLRVSPWDGSKIPDEAANQSRLRTMTGTEYVGSLSGPNAEGQIEIRRGGEVVQTVPEVDVAEIVLLPGSAARELDPNCELAYHDGATLSGRLVKASDDAILLEVPFAKDPLRCATQGLNKCLFPSGDQEVEIASSDHVLEYAGLKLRGTLGAAETWLGWRLVGSQTVIPLDLEEDLVIRRAGDDRSRDVQSGNDRDVVVLHDGDQLPCTVDAIDEHFVTLSSDFAPVTRIPVGDVSQIALRAAIQQAINGFDDPGWQINGHDPKQIEHKSDRILLHDQSSFHHPQLLAGGMLEFDVEWNQTSQTYLMITLMENQNEQRRVAAFGAVERQQMFYLMFNQKQIQVYVMQGNAFRQMHQRANAFKSPARVRIQMIDNEAALFVNDEDQGRMPMDNAEDLPLGVMFQTQSARNQNGQRGGDVGMTISNLQAGRSSGLFFQLPITKSARDYTLTVPRMRRDRPPTHLLIGHNGDLLRGKLLALSSTSALFQSRLDEVTVPRDRLAGIVWLSPPVVPVDEEAANDDGAEEGDLPPADAAAPQEKLEPPPAAEETQQTVRVTFGSGVVLNLVPQEIEGDQLIAHHSILGECRLSLSSINELKLGSGEVQTADTESPAPYREWVLVHAREPVIPGADGGFGTFSELVGKPAADFALPLLDGGRFNLAEQRGKVVVLDFWATWCGPCIAAMPQIMAATSAFPDDVVFVGVNQDENEKVISEFLKARGWELTVALDRNTAVGQKYQVEGIPQTVVIDRDGTIAHVNLGATADLEGALTEVLQALVDGEKPEE